MFCMIAKARIALVVLAIFSTVKSHAASLALVWDPSPSSGVAGYLIRVALPDGTQPVIYDVGNVTNAVVDNLLEGQTYSFYATAYDSNGNQSGPSNTLTYTIRADSASAKYIGSDTTTGGNWKGIYGTQGYWMVGAPASLPAYASVSTSAPQWTWASTTTSQSALMLPGTSTSRIAACWYSATQVGFDFNVNNGQLHRVSMYFLDASVSGRQERVDLVDRATGATLDSRNLSGFANGIYLTWDITGNVSVRVTPTTGNAVISGIFFDGIPPVVTTSARFVQSDTTTRGNWKGVYGSLGYWMVGAPAALPAFARTTTAAPQWVWRTQGTSVSALVLPSSSSDRIEACWYSSSEVRFDFSVTDGQLHRVSMYFLDPTTSGRQERIEVINRDTGAILHLTSLSSFTTGVYLTWDITGNVSIQLTPLSVNAVASGVFFDEPSPGSTG
jgi:hypothetical protein